MKIKKLFSGNPNVETIALAKKILGIGSPSGGERELAESLRDTLGEMGLKVRMYRHSRHSASLIAQAGKKQDLCINCHLDVVPYVSNPLRETGKFIFGAGAVDTKKDIAPLISALSSLKEIPDGLALAFDADEEYGNTGMKAIKGDITAPHVIVNEPTNMEVHIGSRGWTEVELEGQGEQVHSCYSTREDSYCRLVGAMSRIIKHGFKKVDMCGKTGVAVSFFPEKRREDVYAPASAKAGILILNNTHYNTREAIIRGLGLKPKDGVKARITEFYPAFLNQNSEAGNVLAGCGGFGLGVHKAWTNANYFTGRDTVIFGAGDPLLGHTNSEKVEKRHLVLAKRAYVGLFSNIFGDE